MNFFLYELIQLIFKKNKDVLGSKYHVINTTVAIVAHEQQSWNQSPDNKGLNKMVHKPVQLLSFYSYNENIFVFIHWKNNRWKKFSKEMNHNFAEK